jgi:hypothetical protein
MIFDTQYALGLAPEGYDPLDTCRSELVAEPHLEGFTHRRMDRCSSRHAFNVERFVKCYVKVMAQICGELTVEGLELGLNWRGFKISPRVQRDDLSSITLPIVLHRD